jgi:hypothetical protein
LLRYFNFPPHHDSVLMQNGFAYPATSFAWTHFSSRALNSPSCVPASLIARNSGIGISTDCPSPTPRGLGLGPDLPWADEPSPGNLRFSANKILTCFFVTYTGILSCRSSTKLLSLASAPLQCSSTPLVFHKQTKLRCQALAPVHFRRRIPGPVCCYALFK